MFVNISYSYEIDFWLKKKEFLVGVVFLRLIYSEGNIVKLVFWYNDKIYINGT